MYTLSRDSLCRSNTGVGLALLSAVHNVKFCATMPMKMSGEKIAMLKALGADVVRTPNAAAFDDPTSHIGVAKRMVAEEGWVMLDQYSNPGNPEAHYEVRTWFMSLASFCF